MRSHAARRGVLRLELVLHGGVELVRVLGRGHRGQGLGRKGRLEGRGDHLGGGPLLEEVDDAQVVNVGGAVVVQDKLVEPLCRGHRVGLPLLDDTADHGVVHEAEAPEEVRVSLDRAHDGLGVLLRHVEGGGEGLHLALVVALARGRVAQRDHVAPVPALVHGEAALVHLRDVLAVLLHELVVPVPLEVVALVPDDAPVRREAVEHHQVGTAILGPREVEEHGHDERGPVRHVSYDGPCVGEQRAVVAVAELLHEESLVGGERHEVAALAAKELQ
mmetsp:Transcript_6103/g.20837  ORF Transcript_6103/g.20837 Transcript_6103/m.20837 type:complete len:275 (-) Transcript_6103:192-1016(-)